MARLVGVVGLTHNPFLPGLIVSDAEDPAIVSIVEDYERLRRWLDALRPELLLVVASDHLNQWFMDNMPAFSIGMSPAAAGPFPHESRSRGLARYEAQVDVTAARHILTRGMETGVDFASSHEFVMDHAFTVPLTFLRPEMDIPIVPVWTNVMAPPVPSAARFYAVGAALRSLIEELAHVERVAIVTSGHLALDVGGPEPETQSADPDFDRRMVALVQSGSAEAVLRAATWDNLVASGNATPGFLNYLLAMGAVDGAPTTDAGVHFPRATAAAPYFMWDLS